MANQLSQNSAKELKTIIDANIAVPVSPGAPPAAPVDFCSIWPTAKPILQTLAGLVVFIPGVGPGAGAALTALVAAGTAVYEKTCSVP